jgi:hypothetical protein
LIFLFFLDGFAMVLEGLLWFFKFFWYFSMVCHLSGLARLGLGWGWLACIAMCFYIFPIQKGKWHVTAMNEKSFLTMS